jgi:Mg2+ and Co2+ transporter CorA
MQGPAISDDLDTAPVYLMVAETFILSFQGTHEVLRLDRILQRMLNIAAVRATARPTHALTHTLTHTYIHTCERA